MTDTQTKSALTAQQIADLLDASLIGDGTRSVSSVTVIERAEPGQLAFVGSHDQIKRCGNSAADVVIAPPEIADTSSANYPNITFIVVDEPETAFLKVAQELDPPRKRAKDRNIASGCHRSDSKNRIPIEYPSTRCDR